MIEIADHLKEPLVELLLSVADDKLMLGHRNSEGTGLAPILEEDIAFSSLAQDEIAHAQVLYGLASEIDGRSADALAFGRDPDAYRCAQIVELPDDFDWAFALGRQFFCAHFNALRLRRMAGSSYKRLAEISARLESERIGWNALEARGVTASAAFAGGRVTVDDLHARLAGGTVEGEGAVTLTGGETSGDVTLSWTDLDADRLAAVVWPTRPLPIESSLTGTLDAAWTGHDPQSWVVTIDNRHRAPGDAVMPGIPIDGRWRLEGADGEWQVVVEELSAGG